MFKRKFRGAKSGRGQLGIHLSAEGVAIAHAQLTDDKPKVTRFEYQFASQMSEQAEILRVLGEEAAYANLPANIVIPSAKYQLLLVDRPEVKSEELSDALKWSLQELVPFPMEEAVLDFIELPVARASDDKKMVYAAVARRSLINEVAEMLKLANIHIQQIGLPEMALKNIGCLVAPKDTSIALLHLSQGGGKLFYIRDKALYMLRHIELNLEALFNANTIEDPDMVLGQLSTELQRSIDYCVSYLRAPSIEKIMFTPLSSAHKVIAEKISAQLGPGFDILDLNQTVESEHPFELPLQMNGLLALGAALRSADEA